jgi:hypothetical protein
MLIRLRTVKEAVAAVLTDQLGAAFGTVDLDTLDTDNIPQKLRSSAAPVWNLMGSAGDDTPAAFGGGSNLKQIFRTYLLTLEGWWGIRGAEERTAEWDALVEDIADLLELHNITVAQALDDADGGVIELERVTWRDVRLVRITEGTAVYRAHHAVIECRARVFLTLVRA